MKYTNTDDSILEKLSLKLERISSQAYNELVLGSKLKLLNQLDLKKATLKSSK